jgi:two-component system nitrate/nitrite response regulator NarL
MVASSPNLRLLIVADDPLARVGLAALLAGVPGVNVVGQSHGGGDVVTDLEVYRPDVVLWDIGWEPLRVPTGAAAPPPEPGERRSHLEQLLEVREARYPVVLLLADEAQAAILWAVGLRCLLWREVSAEKLVSALAATLQGLVVLDESLLGALLPSAPLQPGPIANPLTRREFDVLQLLAEGLPNKIIADRLQISEHTVKFHINALMDKLQAQSRTEAVVRAMRSGLLPL